LPSRQWQRKKSFVTLTPGRKVFQAVDPMPALPGVSPRGGSLHQQRLSHILHEEEDSDRAGRARQDFAKIWQPCLVKLQMFICGFVPFKRLSWNSFKPQLKLSNKVFLFSKNSIPCFNLLAIVKSD